MKAAYIVLWVLCFFRQDLWALEVSWKDLSYGRTNFSAVLTMPDSSKTVLAGSKNSLFKAVGKEMVLKHVLSAGPNNRINKLFYDAGSGVVYCLTTNGLYFSNNKGNSWKRIFKGRDIKERNCVSILILPESRFLGTDGGLFISKNNSNQWQKETGVLGNACIYSLAANKLYLFCASDRGFFRKLHPGGVWEKMITFYSNPETKSEEEKQEESPDNGSANQANYVVADKLSEFVYLATSRGVLKSKDNGFNWEQVSNYGLLSEDVKEVAVGINSRLYAITRSGIFIYLNERWNELSFSISAGMINSVDLNKDGSIYLATEKGLFKSRNKSFLSKVDLSIPKEEPDIKDVQKAAIDYAEVAPEKIALWRKKAAVKAILPQLSAGIDRDTSDLWHWESGSTTKNDDDALRRGDDSLGWDVRLTWNLGELIWNQDQTSIDARSKLMVQLRGDILDEINKLYFERIRVKIELDDIAVGDQKGFLQKKLRLEELTAQLDGLTGGYYSKHLK